MITNERPTTSGHRSRPRSGAKAHVAEKTLKTDKLQVERKTFLFILKENPRGRFLRITEDVGGRRDTIIVPTTGLEEFKQRLEQMLKAAQEIKGRPAQPPAPSVPAAASPTPEAPPAPPPPEPPPAPQV